MARKGVSALPRKYDTDADLMRVAAAFFVVMIHASGTRTLAAVSYNALARFSVPVFIMLSGWYMLARPIDGKRLARKIGTLLALSLAWSAVFYVYDLLCGARSWEGPRALAAYLLTQPFHLWYLWALIALYLFTPLFSVFVGHAARPQYRYALLLTFVFGSPVVIALRSGRAPVLAAIVDNMKVAYLLGFVFCYLLGGYFRRWGCDLGGKRGRGVLYALGALGLLVTVFGTRRLSAGGEIDQLLESFFAPNVLASSAAFFVLVKRICAKRSFSPRFSAVLRESADCTLGVYLLHPLLLLMLQRGALMHALYDGPDLVFVPLRTALVFVAATLLVLLVKRVPLLKRLVATH